MNVLILTPDAVGSTLLQRALTVQMLLSDFDRPVINLHELTNGLHSYYNYELQTMVLGKSMGPAIGQKIGYGQKLHEIVELLSSVDHYKTSRLAHYHLVRRNDSKSDQDYFYDYLNNNFFIISARRRNLFEFGLSWSLRGYHKKLNVYEHFEKVSAFYEMYKDPVILDTEVFLKNLIAYKDYIDWTNNFEIGSYFYYEDHVPALEDYILSLPIFAGKNKTTWKDSFNITFNDYNKCHKSSSDIGTLALTSSESVKLLQHDTRSNSTVTQIIQQHLPIDQRNFLDEHKLEYAKASNHINHIVKLGMMVSGIPIKKHTFAEKRHVVKNFYECLQVYNDWIINYPNLGQPIDDNKISLSLIKEDSNWIAKE